MGYYTKYNLEIEDPKSQLTLDEVARNLAPKPALSVVWEGTQIRELSISPVPNTAGHEYRLMIKDPEPASSHSVRLTRDSLISLAARISLNIKRTAEEQTAEDKYRFMKATLEGEEAKWYEWKEDMLKVSQKWPLVLFKLSKQGEDRDDRTIELFRNNKHQSVRAKITFDDEVKV